MSRFKEEDIVICYFLRRFDKETKYLTKGKIYKVNMVMQNDILILNDKSMYEYYSDSFFLTKEEYRSEIINNILD